MKWKKGLGLSSFRKHKNTIQLVCILYTTQYIWKPFEALRLICVMSKTDNHWWFSLHWAVNRCDRIIYSVSWNGDPNQLNLGMNHQIGLVNWINRCIENIWLKKTVCSVFWWYFRHELLIRPWQPCPQWIMSLFILTLFKTSRMLLKKRNVLIIIFIMNVNNIWVW